MPKEVLERLRNYHSKSYFEKAALNIMVKQTPDNLKDPELKKLFSSLDTEGDGMISLTELKDKIKESHLIECSDKELKNLINELDYAGNGKINYSEFFAAALDVHQFFSEAQLRSAFSIFDLKHDNQISALELQKGFHKLGQEISEEQAQKLIELHDKNHSGTITFEEFKSIF